MDEGHFSGTVGGHVIPGSFFAGFGLFFLVLTAQRLFKAESNEEFCSNHIPERSTSILRRVSLVLIICTILGICIEGLGGQLFLGEEGHSFFRNLQHITLYTMFCFAGVVGLFESYQFLPNDSFRAAVAVALLGETIIWHEHSLMKMNLVDARIHALVAFTSFGSATLMAISVYKPDHLVPFIGSFLFMLWQGLWLFAAAYNIQAKDKFDLEENTSYFILEGVLLGIGVLVVSVFLHQQRAASSRKKENYLRVELTLDDNDDNDDALTTETEQDSSESPKSNTSGPQVV